MIHCTCVQPDITYSNLVSHWLLRAAWVWWLHLRNLQQCQWWPTVVVGVVLCGWLESTWLQWLGGAIADWRLGDLCTTVGGEEELGLKGRNLSALAGLRYYSISWVTRIKPTCIILGQAESFYSLYIIYIPWYFIKLCPSLDRYLNPINLSTR